MICLEADVSFECFHSDKLWNIIRDVHHFSSIIGFTYSFSQINEFTSFYDKLHDAFTVHLDCTLLDKDSYLIKNDLPENVRYSYLDKDFLKEHNLEPVFKDINIPYCGNIDIIQEVFENLLTICFTTEYFVPIYLEDVIIRIDDKKVYGKDKDFTNLIINDDAIIQYRNNMTTKFSKQKYDLLREDTFYDEFVKIINQYKALEVKEKESLTITKTKRKAFVFE